MNAERKAYSLSLYTAIILILVSLFPVSGQSRRPFENVADRKALSQSLAEGEDISFVHCV